MFSLVRIISVCCVVMTATVWATPPSTVLVHPLTANKTQPNLVPSDTSKQTLRAKLAVLHAFSSDFQQTVYAVNGQVLQHSSGTIAVAKPNKINWHTTKPDESLIVSDGTALWVYDPFIEQVTAYRLNSALANTPLLLLSDNSDKSWQQYQVSQIADNGYTIQSNDPDSQVKTFTVYFTDQHITKLNLVDATGQVSDIVLSHVTDLTTTTTSPLFTFNMPKGVELDDQR